MKIDNFHLNDNEKAAVLSYAANNAFPQTLLIEGGTMDERIEFARFLANMIVCQAQTDKPCGKCGACIKCEARSHPDVREYGEQKEKYVFRVDVSREIRSDAFIIPNDSDKKVYIIKEAQNMNDSAENALLKILEEPPYFDYFILTCDSRSAMLDTVLSRSTIIRMGTDDESFDGETLDYCNQVVDAICSDSELELLEVLGTVASDKKAFIGFIRCLRRILLEALRLKSSADYNKQYEKSVRTLCNKFSQAKIHSLIAAASEFEEQFNQNANYNLLITFMSVRINEIRRIYG